MRVLYCSHKLLQNTERVFTGFEPRQNYHWLMLKSHMMTILKIFQYNTTQMAEKFAIFSPWLNGISSVWTAISLKIFIFNRCL